MKRKYGSTSIIAMACAVLLSVPARAQSPLDHAHAHNDYEHARPLLDALDRGFGSGESDIYLVDAALLVAHARDSVRDDRTLESLYLAPLRTWIAARGGHVYVGRAPDLDSTHAPSAAAMPLVSDDWKNITQWRGRRAPPVLEHPSLPVVWRLPARSGVDLIGADDLDALRRFLADSSGRDP